MAGKRTAPTAEKTHTLTANPFRDLLEFAAAARMATDHVDHLRLRDELRRLGDAAMKCANLTGYAIKVVEIRVGALERFCRGAFTGHPGWQDGHPGWDDLLPGPEENARGEPQGLAKDSTAWKDVEELASGFEAHKDEPRAFAIRTLGQLIDEIDKRESAGNVERADLFQIPGVKKLASVATQLLRQRLSMRSLREMRSEFCTPLGLSIDQGNHTALEEVAAALWDRHRWVKAQQAQRTKRVARTMLDEGHAPLQSFEPSKKTTDLPRRMLFMAGCHASESDFDSKRKRLLEVLLKWRQQHGYEWMPFRVINRKLPWTGREHEEVRDTLVAQRLIEYQITSTGGRPGGVYRLASQRGCNGVERSF
jgi:hypothetical protein